MTQSQIKTDTIYIHIYQSGINSYTKLPMFTAIGLHKQYTQEEWASDYSYLGVLVEVMPYDVEYTIEDAINSEVDKLKHEIHQVDANSVRRKTDIQSQINELLMIGVSEQ